MASSSVQQDLSLAAAAFSGATAFASDRWLLDTGGQSWAVGLGSAAATYAYASDQAISTTLPAGPLRMAVPAVGALLGAYATGGARTNGQLGAALLAGALGDIVAMNFGVPFAVDAGMDIAEKQSVTASLGAGLDAGWQGLVRFAQNPLSNL